MIFKKKKRMIDIRELQRRGVVRIPKKDIVIPTNQEGFIEFQNRSKQIETESDNKQPTTNQTNTEFFGFMDSTSSTTPSESIDRKESERITELDNRIYKLENRIELLEKKLDVNQPSNSSVGVMVW